MGCATTVTCDQAIFTSVRSIMGEGYRIIAASAGVQADEKIEITRRSPSHGGLVSDDPGAVGLEAYALPSGRHCVAYCCHAGCEHTARGGQRVYTHAVVLEQEAWRAMQANPLTIHAALAQYVQSKGPMLKPAARLEKIPLSVIVPAPCEPAAAGDDSGSVCTHDNGHVATADIPLTRAAECARAAAEELLSGRQLILLDAPNPLGLLEKVLLSIPLDMRDTLDVSAGIKYSPARKIRLVLTTESHLELQRKVTGQNIQLRPANDADMVVAVGCHPEVPSGTCPRTTRTQGPKSLP